MHFIVVPNYLLVVLCPLQHWGIPRRIYYIFYCLHCTLFTILCILSEYFARTSSPILVRYLHCTILFITLFIILHFTHLFVKPFTLPFILPFTIISVLFFIILFIVLFARLVFIFLQPITLLNLLAFL